MASSSNPSSWTTNLNKVQLIADEQQRFQLHHIDDAIGVASGPNARNALQVVSEALDISQQEHEQKHPISEAEAEVEQQLKTIVASDSDVSNGFVKCGRSLPYVFEATETGTSLKFQICAPKNNWAENLEELAKRSICYKTKIRIQNSMKNGKF